jgi:hypothetical protein
MYTNKLITVRGALMDYVLGFYLLAFAIGLAQGGYWY